MLTVDHFQVLEVLLDDPSKSPKQVVEERCWHQVSDETSLAMVCRQVLEENPKVVSTVITDCLK